LGKKELLGLAAALESRSEHPLARAVLRAALDEGLTWGEPREFESHTGAGIVGDVSGRRVTVGTAAFLQDRGLDLSSFEQRASTHARLGLTPVFVAVDGQAAGVLAIADPPRAEAAQVVRDLKALGVEVILLTGDRQEVADAVAAQLGITRAIAEARPEDKAYY